ncbi:MAG: hypothetical protein RL693_1863, partial [Verrucomicrobiota bacterium]
MLSQLDLLQTEGLTALASITDETGLETFRVSYLGKKGSVT